MASVCGWLGKVPTLERNSLLERMGQGMSTLAQRDQQHWSFASLCTASLSPHVQHQNPLGCLWVLGTLKGPHLDHAHPYDHLLHMVQRTGMQAFGGCTGHFVCLVLLKERQTLYVITDPWARIPVFYSPNTGERPFFLATHLQSLLPALRHPTFNPQWLLSAGLWDHSPTTTCLKECHSMPPGHVLTVQAHQWQLQPYGAPPRRRSHSHGTLAQRSQQLRDHTQHAVHELAKRCPEAAWYTDQHAEAEVGERFTPHTWRHCSTRYVAGTQPVHDNLSPQIGHHATISASDFVLQLPTLVARANQPLVHPEVLSCLFAAQDLKAQGLNHLVLPWGLRELLGTPAPLPPETARSWRRMWPNPRPAHRPEPLGMRRVFTSSVLMHHEDASSMESSLLQRAPLWFQELHPLCDALGLQVHLPWFEEGLSHFALNLSSAWVTRGALLQATYGQHTLNAWHAPFPRTPPLRLWLKEPCMKNFVGDRLRALSQHHWFDPSFLDMLYLAESPLPAALHERWLMVVLSLSEWLNHLHNAQHHWQRSHMGVLHPMP